MRASFQRIFCATILCSLILFFSGCGGGKQDMSGKVSYNGKALKGGFVTFVAAGEGPTFSATIQEDGTYTMPGVLAGEYKVCVETESLKGSKPTGSAGMTSKGGAKGGGPENPLAKVKENKPPEGAGKDSGYTPGGPPAAMAAANAAKYVQIPNEYSKAETTTLSVTVKSGQPTFDITLK
ncbi:hypothetical protein VT84_14730 [Gemmata sp. SH-PL17]|nr:hypothetical protein VT84_14730 [Gemmata sp. SH-PL17]